MKRRDLILGSTSLLIPGIARVATPCPPPQLGISGGTSVTTTCPTSSKPSYSTSFPATENPISEGGRWTNGTIFGGGGIKTAVQTIAGVAYGTMTAPGNFPDSCACLSGFGPDHQVVVTLVNNGVPRDECETEILLRADITAAHVFLYEVDILGYAGIQLVRWDMTVSNPSNYSILRNANPGEMSIASGAQVRAKAVGTVITVETKAVGGSFSTLFTYDTAGNSTKYLTGNPGVGFWNSLGADHITKFGFDDFSAVTL